MKVSIEAPKERDVTIVMTESQASTLVNLLSIIEIDSNDTGYMGELQTSLVEAGVSHNSRFDFTTTSYGGIKCRDSSLDVAW